MFILSPLSELNIAVLKFCYYTIFLTQIVNESGSLKSKLKVQVEQRIIKNFSTEAQRGREAASPRYTKSATLEIVSTFC